MSPSFSNALVGIVFLIYAFGTVPSVFIVPFIFPVDILPSVLNAMVVRSVSVGYLVQFGRSFTFTITAELPFPTCTSEFIGISQAAAE